MNAHFRSGIEDEAESSWQPLARWLGEALNSPEPSIASVERLSGGAIQENLLVRAIFDTGPRDFVIRRDAGAAIAASKTRLQEFTILKVAAAAGVTVPEPIAFCEEPTIIGAPFALMARVDGAAFGPRIVKDMTLGGDRETLVARLGEELARIHSIKPPMPELAFLSPPPTNAALTEIATLRLHLDQLRATRPALEWGLRWAELHAPSACAPALTHRDFRTGNLMLDAAGLTGVLDWEFADWGDPMADLGWFCAECWRFGRADLEAGGLGSRDAFYRGYEAAGGILDDARVRYWEIVAHIRWAVIALQQGERHSSGREASLQHALTGRIAAELELFVMRAIAPAKWVHHVA